MRIFTASIRIKLSRLAFPALLLCMLTARALAQTEPEAPREPEKLTNGYQISFYAGGSMLYTNGYYNGLCPCEFLFDATSTNVVFGGSLNIPVFQDMSLYLRAGLNSTSTAWFTARTDSLLSTPATGYVGSDLTFDYDLLNLDVLIRLIGRMDGERVYIGPSFGVVRKKNVRIVDTEISSGLATVVEDAPLDVEHDLRVSLIIGAEYAFTPMRNLYVIPALEVDYPFGKILQERTERPNFSMRPTFYKLLLTISYQLF